MKAWPQIAVAIVLTACSPLSGDDVPINLQTDPAHNLDVAMALVEHLFNNNEAAGVIEPEDKKRKPDYIYIDAFCLSFNGDDPPLDFMKNYRDDIIPILPFSHCKSNGSSWVDKDGQNAIVFVIDAIKCVSSETCYAKGGYRQGNLSAAEHLYQLEKDQEGWKVTRDELQWVN